MKHLAKLLTTTLFFLLFSGCSESKLEKEELPEVDTPVSGTISNGMLSGTWSSFEDNALPGDFAIDFHTNDSLAFYYTNDNSITEKLLTTYEISSNSGVSNSDGFNDTLKIHPSLTPSRSGGYSYIYVYRIVGTDITFKLIEENGVVISSSEIELTPFSNPIEHYEVEQIDILFGITFPFDENGEIWKYEVSTYTNGVVTKTEEYNSYLWGKTSDGYYNYSDNPSLWSTPVTQDGYKWITDKGYIWAYLQESRTTQPFSNDDGLVVVCDSITVNHSYTSWDGTTRSALIAYEHVVDGTQGKYEKPENGTVEIWYITSEGIERWETYSPAGELIEVSQLKARVREYTYVPEEITDDLIDLSTVMTAELTSEISDWYTIQFDSDYSTVTNTYSDPMSDLSTISVTITDPQTSSLSVIHQSKIKVGDLDSLVITYRSNKKAGVFVSNLGGTWGIQSAVELPATATVSSVKISASDFIYTFGDESLCELDNLEALYFEFTELSAGDVIDASIESIKLYRAGSTVIGTETKWIDQCNYIGYDTYDADWGVIEAGRVSSAPYTVDLALDNPEVDIFDFYFSSNNETVRDFSLFEITYSSTIPLRVALSDKQVTWEYGVVDLPTSTTTKTIQVPANKIKLNWSKPDATPVIADASFFTLISREPLNGNEKITVTIENISLFQ